MSITHSQQSDFWAGVPRWKRPVTWAMMMLCATIPLISVGGLVTTHKAGMAVPDWPSTYGYNMFAYPLSTWFFGPWDIFIEHGHRLFGSLVGLLTIGFVVMTFKYDSRTWMKVVAMFALVLVIFQGALGGMRVLLDQVLLAKIHGCTAPLFVALTAALVLWNTNFWQQITGQASTLFEKQPKYGFVGISSLGVLTSVAIFLQIVLGANIRHLDPMMTHEQFRGILFFHLIVVAVLSVLVLFLISWVICTWKQAKYMKGSAFFLLSCFCAQIFLGPTTWFVKYGWPFGESGILWIDGYLIHPSGMGTTSLTTLHVVTGSFILASAVWMTLRAFKIEQVLKQIIRQEQVGTEVHKPQSTIEAASAGEASR